MIYFEGGNIVIIVLPWQRELRESSQPLSFPARAPPPIHGRCQASL